ncbi:Rieske (2Fe-2S) protein [Microbulbifer thermotolerans]|uniref:Rieske (2Fe-2S) protein n=1 Tax=Microbulbifer thermotolerans TaxID=252514 RepID=A0A143HJJ9_MICTH|nr:Rieske (2Fe-2S) protein [Microbulbifer thermotolerans]AMX01889.1 Rieske (2Fe-2S) protein [Microbulbifer thermotolerans]MCX2779212.1 Rieske (2Fe-2S) protein [Microbulbifer thermotolerans]MCX2793558.1 Rieske (2Fe-2S) protein [Microbulbifer thermotolerans]MCX2801572.1 Rieske (2Fe-2S) protein [Microbulbifer thermotolerans]MCX2803636.1 Rieske (2Fe-2S) protein [Microbulbifer thermotolerans]
MQKYLLCRHGELTEGQSKGFSLGDSAAGTANVFAVMKNGEVFAYKNNCPHRGINLEWQEDQFLDPDGALIQCASHGALFQIETGECVAGPCAGDALTPVPIEYGRDGIYVLMAD